MEAKDKIDLALRAAITANAMLKMVSVGSKVHAKVIMADVIDHVMKLDEKITALPND